MILVKGLIKIIVILFTTAVVVVNGAVYTLAVGNGILKNNIIAPEGKLFYPDSWATRGTVVMALYNLAENRIIQGQIKGFLDVPKDNPYYPAVSYCSSKDYISGYPDGTFKPEGFITRAEICTLLSGYLNLFTEERETFPLLDIFSDVSEDHWAAGFISAIIDNGLMAGYEDRTFRPESNVTRAELSAVITNVKHLEPPGYIRRFEDVSDTHWAYEYVASVSIPPLPEPNPDELEIARLVNGLRGTVNADELDVDPALCEVARAKARDMIDNNYFDHLSPKWGAPEEMMRAFGIRLEKAGENIGIGAQNPEEIIEAWKASPSHYEEMISKGYTRIGAGFEKRGDGMIFWVLEFTG